VIWYQGESNGSKGYEYRTLFSTMIKDWRHRWGQGDFPFLAVQLAPFAAFNNADGPQWAELREAQDYAAKVLPRVGVAIITDVGEKNDIHPPRKEPVGARLALLARRIAYGEELISSGPVFNSMTLDGNKFVLSFDNVGAGLEARGGPLKDFTVCGENRQFVPAQAEIKAGTVIVWADGVEKPIAVRYGWRNYPEGNLFNKRGLPAGPFRTDDFPLTSAPAP
jgi:sialate O-acetylesterase